MIEEAVRAGRFVSVEQAVDEALRSITIVKPALLSPAERAEAILKWAEERPKNKEPLSDEAMSRESIYSERG
jgi:acyl-CoA reductase-like NAD-dependent aldehyde dehydrogenase